MEKMSVYEEVRLGRSSVWYWVKEKNQVFKCKYAAKGDAMPAVGEVKDVIQYEGKYYVRFGKGYSRIG